ncbi:hypothetical protein BKA65DRAFT_556646 [Rhexocercosporidium sp. MPI-PUGE-AT-0058]|nr:hypothetical protein BKA65DRAFT_556646 [Rhexocercosporidium sp. MPI-PUGE-AT-0058]
MELRPKAVEPAEETDNTPDGVPKVDAKAEESTLDEVGSDIMLDETPSEGITMVSDGTDELSETVEVSSAEDISEDTESELRVVTAVMLCAEKEICGVGTAEDSNRLLDRLVDMLANKLLKIALEQLSGHDGEVESGPALESFGGNVMAGRKDEMMIDVTGGEMLVGKTDGTTAGIEEVRALEVEGTAGGVLVDLLNVRVPVG